MSAREDDTAIEVGPCDPGPPVEAYEDTATGPDADAWPEPLDLHALASTEPETPPMIIDDWLPAGYATLLGGHGDAGKSSIALHLAVSIATGSQFFGLEVGQRRVLYLSCEDRERVLHWRLSRVAAYRGIDLADLTSKLDALDLVGHDTVLFQRDAQLGTHLTAAYSTLAARLRRYGTEVLIVDGIADTFAGNENARAEVKRFVNSLVALIPPERGAVLLIAHVNKVTAASARTSEGYSGSTGWHNAARARWYLRPEVEQSEEGDAQTGDLLLDLQKSNLGHANQSLRFRWDDDAHLFVGERMLPASEFDRRARESEERDAILAALREVAAGGDYCPATTQGQRSAYRVLAASSAFPNSLRGNTKAHRDRFYRHLEALRRNRTVVESSVRRANRHTTPVLVLGDSEGAACATASQSSEHSATHPTQRDADASCVAASQSHGGYGGCAHTPDACPRCGGEGGTCRWCGGSGRQERAQ